MNAIDNQSLSHELDFPIASANSRNRAALLEPVTIGILIIIAIL